MPKMLKSYSKWFQLLYWLFWPISLASLFAFQANTFTLIINLVAGSYLFLVLVTFVVESIIHLVK